MENDDDIHLKEFKAFMKERFDASTEFVEGNFQPLKEISTTESPATIFPPTGMFIRDAIEVNKFNEQGAVNFRPGAKNEFEIFHQDADERLAYWTGIQKSKVKMSTQSDEVIFNLRITEIFRKEEGKWKLIHRHADQLKDK
jgi:ketosteroid isomerase-like protein